MRNTVLKIIAVLAIAPFWNADSSVAQNHAFAFHGAGGVGGSLDESDVGFGNFNWQVGFSHFIQDNTLVGIRVAGLDFGSSDNLGGLTDPSLLYVTVAGEMHERSSSFSGSFIESGIYIGLGYYSLDGTLSDGTDETDDGVGFVVGLTGDMPLISSGKLALHIELQGHWANLDAASIFAMAQIGLAYRF